MGDGSQYGKSLVYVFSSQVLKISVNLIQLLVIIINTQRRIHIKQYSSNVNQIEYCIHLLHNITNHEQLLQLQLSP